MVVCIVPVVLWAVVILAIAAPATAPSADVYRCVATTMPVAIDGKLDDAAWSTADWTADFVDVVGGDAHPQPPPLRTRAKLLWDERFLYVAAEIEETDVHAAMRQHDMPLFREGAFEIFLDPDDDGRDYFELEANAIGTTFDLVMDKPYRDGGHADDSFDVADLKCGVHVDGTLDDRTDRDGGWTVELAIPWTSLKRIGVNRAPRRGDRWRMELGRSPGRVGGRFSTWRPHGRGDMHMPEKWGYVEFAREH
jgi:hypothetical protein